MIRAFFLVCKDCFEKGERGEKAVMGNIHVNPNGIIELTCLNCGKEEKFIPDQLKKTTKKDYFLLQEKAKIENFVKKIKEIKKKN